MDRRLDMSEIRLAHRSWHLGRGVYLHVFRVSWAAWAAAGLYPRSWWVGCWRESGAVACQLLGMGCLLEVYRA